VGRAKWRPPRWAPPSHVKERSPPQQVGNARHSPPDFSVSPRDGVDNLWTTETAREVKRAPQGVPLYPPQLVSGSHNSRISGPATREVRPQQVQVQPNRSSFFLPGHSWQACSLLTWLRLHHQHPQLPILRHPRCRHQEEAGALWRGGHGTLADGSCIPFCGIIELAGRVRDRNIQETFIIGQLNEDAILGMPFLQRHGCHIDFSKSVMVMGNKELTCVDKLGRSLAGGIQVVRSCTMPGRSRATVHCKVDGGYSSGLGVVESMHSRIRPAHSLNRLTG